MHNSAAQMARRIPSNTEENGRLREVAAAFLRLGFTGFGGAAAHIAMMEQEFVQRRKWLTREDFVDRVGAVSLLPGPSSTELAIYLGELRGGLAGLLIAGCSFILPSAVLVGILAWVFQKFGRAPQVGAVVFGGMAVLRADLVEHLHWLTENQLIDAIAVSQGTPGPFFTAATFVGYVIAGWKGAVLATAGMFLPAFSFVAVTAKYLPKLRKSLMAGTFLDGVNAAAVGVMAFLGWEIARGGVVRGGSSCIGGGGWGFVGGGLGEFGGVG